MMSALAVVLAAHVADPAPVRADVFFGQIEALDSALFEVPEHYSVVEETEGAEP